MYKIDHLASFLAGIGIGVAASVLLAPEPGAQTRGRIRDAASRAGDVFTDGIKTLSDAAGAVLVETKPTWNDKQKEGS